MALTGMIFAVAALYASVGQAGASGYLAVMGFMALDPSVMKPAALILNLTVAAIGTAHFARAGLFRWTTFYPFGVLATPFSCLGGLVTLPARLYYPVVWAILLLAGVEMARSTWSATAAGRRPVAVHPPFWPALPPMLPWWLAAAGLGGAIGAWLGSRHLPAAILRGILSAILILSGLRMLAV